jgi:hypothetical protein
MKKLPFLLAVIGIAVLTSAVSQTPPQISIKAPNGLTDGSGTPGICALSNIKKSNGK